MASDKRISELDEAATVADSHLFVVAESDVKTRKLSFATLKSVLGILLDKNTPTVTAQEGFSITSAGFRKSLNVVQLACAIKNTNALTANTTYIVAKVASYVPAYTMPLKATNVNATDYTASIAPNGNLSIRPKVAINANQTFYIGGLYIIG